MGWMDLNEYFLIEDAARDRLDDLCRTTGWQDTKADPSALSSSPQVLEDIEMSPHVDATSRRPDPDRQLVKALRLREPTAAERLVTMYGDRTYRLASRITGNQEDAEEVVQDVFWTVIRKIDTFRGDAAFGSWLYRIVTNAAYQKLRIRRARRADLSLDEVLPFFDGHGRHGELIADWSAKVHDPSLQAEVRAALTSAIGELPAASRTVLVLRDVEGLSNLETGEALSISVPSVKSRLHRARLFLRERLRHYMARRPGNDPSTKVIAHLRVPVEEAEECDKVARQPSSKESAAMRGSCKVIAAELGPGVIAGANKSTGRMGGVRARACDQQIQLWQAAGARTPWPGN